MVLKVYVSGMSGNKEVKKRQQRVLMILDSKNIKYDTVDITEPGKESEKELMQNKSTSSGGTVSDPEPRHPLPPQLFNDDEYCGDYDAFDMANEIDTLEVFLKLATADTTAVSTAQIELKQENGEAKKEEAEAEAEEKKPDEEKPEGGEGDAKDEAAEKAENEDGDGEDKKKAEGEGEDAAENADEKQKKQATITTAVKTSNSSDSQSDLFLESERAAAAQ
ncbi:SH3 domain-binding glutamic acid-rich protein homolog isoform X5 [Drosophila biarmipes]|uniref:SH3 domain-binding glutamic acid-rich protein homolog isoform X5 n=1 Tax=Drosophila biarmipes TaxID=125945 RepID=UPI001CDA9A69|nr:SH3 domain-binding glutamic acid-rich protein homolog isoform X5 [Drosophila biarmipes]